jgi:hypothetical protein
MRVFCANFIFCVLHREKKQKIENELALAKSKREAEIEEQRKRKEALALAQTRQQAEIEEQRKREEALALAQTRQQAEAEEQRKREVKSPGVQQQAAERAAYLEELKRQTQNDTPKKADTKNDLDDIEIEMDPDAGGSEGVGPGDESPSSPFVGAGGDVAMRKKSSAAAKSRERFLKKGQFGDTSADAARVERFRKVVDIKKQKLNEIMAKSRQVEELPPVQVQASVEDTVSAKRPLLYTAGTAKWRPYAEGVEVVAAHIRSLLIQNGMENGEASVTLHLSTNSYTDVIYSWFVHIATLPLFSNRLNAISSIQQIQDEYTVLDAIGFNVKSNQEEEADVFWQNYLTRAKDSLRITRENPYGTTNFLNLGSDASEDFAIDVLSRRLEQLRDF